MRTLQSLAFGVAVCVAGASLQGCRSEGCLGGEAGCKIPSPCTSVSFTCEAKPLVARPIAEGETVPGGWDALAARDDIFLSNGRINVVIAGLGNANFLDPNGGSILDLSNVDKNNDGLNQMLQVVGILPADGAHYTELEIIREPDRVGVQLKGTLDERPDLTIATLYELRACDDGVRIRTEAVNGSPDTQLWALSDGFYWSAREALPFTPAAGAGFTHPSFDLLSINDAYEKFPYLAASSHSAPYASYAHVSCQEKQMEGFQSDSVSSSGKLRTVVPPRGHLIFERFLAVADGKDASAASTLALDIRKQLFNEEYVTLSGTVERVGALSVGTERETSIIVSTQKGCRASGALSQLICDKDAPSPWSQVVPDNTGKFSTRVPKGLALHLEVHSFGQKALEREIDALESDRDLGELTLPSTARVTFSVVDGLGAGVDAEILVIPADEATANTVKGTFHGRFGACAPWLGPPPGASPACNHILVASGQATVEIPTGAFHFYAFKGPFWTLARQTVTLTPTASSLSFILGKLPLQPVGTLGADLHVHGAASFDSSIPDEDRVRSFSAMDMDVIAATDHDVVYNYADTVTRLGLTGRLSVIAGTETTGHIPFMRIPNYGFPLVIGHYNFWPLQYKPGEPHNGGVNDERREPGVLFDQITERFDAAVPVIQLNHPWATPEFGRDLGYPRALALNTLKDLPASDDGTAAGMYVRTPKGKAANNGHHAQEVMNGSSSESLLQYRAFWFYLLSQGQLRTGTANSDSHSLADNTIGVPRNVVYASTRPGFAFNVDTFDTAIREGRVLGTNGPVIEATVDAATGPARNFSLTPFAPAPAGQLHLRVSAAPWVPVKEIRIIVNSRVVKTINAAALSTPPDPFGLLGLLRFSGDINLSELLPATGDAWMVIEAGSPLPISGDLAGVISNDPDGIPDTSDNNGDGVVDKSDIKDGSRSGPLVNPRSVGTNDPQFHFAQVVQDAYPFGFTNPFVFDRNGNGQFEAPLVKGAP
ncbi:MAG: CehA/McbA family metallohydrolase [Myxococcaceae bacterium]